MMSSWIEIFSSEKALIKKEGEIIEITDVKSFLQGLIKGTSFLPLVNFTSIELMSQALPDSLVMLVIKIDQLIDKIESIQKALTNPLKWLTSPKFQCKKDCKLCCAFSYFFPSELNDLSSEITGDLIHDEEGKWVILKKANDQRCLFFDIDKQFSCQIHQSRPIRCQIYPFFPIIHRNEIFIFQEEQIRMKNDTSQPSQQCPGLQSNYSDKNFFEKIIRSYVQKSLELPIIASTLVVSPKNVLK